jgi:hypothetical protein
VQLFKNNLADIDIQMADFNKIKVGHAKYLKNKDIRRYEKNVSDFRFSKSATANHYSAISYKDVAEIFSKNRYILYIFTIFFYILYIYIFFFIRNIYKNKKNLFLIFVTLCRIEDLAWPTFKNAMSATYFQNPYNSLQIKQLTVSDFQINKVGHMASKSATLLQIRTN